MPDDIFPNENDAVLLPFLSGENEAVAEDCLNQLFEKIIIPQIRKILASYLTLTFYISTVTFNCRKDFILCKQPEWRRNDHRLRRMRDGGELIFFADDAGIQFICLKSPTESGSEMEFEEIVALVCQKYPNHLFLKTQVLAPIILETAQGAVPKNELIKAILKITDSVNIEEIELPEEMGEHFQTFENEELIAKRQKVHLRRVWDEIQTFPANQRKVLILSLKESGKTEVVTLLLKKRIATIKEIADVLEISLEEFFNIFEKLPMSSLEIADFLSLEDGENLSKEQKVDNLRRIARDLLRRRLGIRK